MANLGSLTLGRGTNTADVREFGAHLSATYQIMEKHFVFGGVGMAKVDNSTQLPDFVFNTTTNLITAPGILQNIVSRIGWDYRVTEDLSWITELSRYQTTTKLSSTQNQLNIVGSFETGVQLRF